MTKLKLVRPSFASNLDLQATLWIARLCIGMPSSINQLNDSVYAEDIRKMLGLSPVTGAFAKAVLIPLLKARVVELATQRPRRKSGLTGNIAMLGELLGLDPLQEALLAFAALAQQHPFLSDFLDGIRITSIEVLAKLLAIALNVREADVRTALHQDSQLFTSRIICIESGFRGGSLKLELTNSLLTALFSNADNLNMLMQSFIETSLPANLTAEAFTHLAQETALLTAYLTKASSSNLTGINILIYGPPGTGKTEYVRWLAASVQKQLYQVRATNDQDKSISGTDRLAFFQLSQRFLHKSNALMLFDEIEDVFPGSNSVFDMLLGNNAATAGKMYINRLLENNPIPTLWVSNEVAHIDKAYLRRFDFSFEMNVPPIAVRRGILETYLQQHQISAETMHYLAQQTQLSPAQIEKAAKVLKLTTVAKVAKPSVKSEANVSVNEATLLLVLENSMALLAQDKIAPSLNLAECSYQLAYLNPDCDLALLIAQLKHAPESVGALCFYGASGTGKTALAHYIAREMALPLMVRRASDIISPYVGKTEQNIAAMFKQAQQDHALLLLDEADSFLSDRKAARHAWEITAVNEMLTQMEAFQGLFICATNLMHKLDEASLRRFALKVKFDYLKPEQRWQLFQDQTNMQDQTNKLSPEHAAEYSIALNQLNNLTPGDFATVRRQAMLLDVALTAPELLKRLKHECHTKNGSNTRQIGFMPIK